MLARKADAPVRVRLILALPLLTAIAAGPPARADNPEPVDSSPTVLTIIGLSGATLDVTSEMLGQLPTAIVAEHMEDGGPATLYEGPLLWSVLDRAGALSRSLREQAAEAVLVSGEASTTALLAMAEIAPGFEAKSVILADRQDGHPLPPGTVTLVVPNDHKDARHITTVTRIAIVSP